MPCSKSLPGLLLHHRSTGKGFLMTWPSVRIVLIVPRPIGSPLYFEDPFINSDIRPVVLYHEFPESSLTGGGEWVVLAIQARFVLTERLQFYAFTDGFAGLEADSLPEGEGFNNLGVGLKYAF